MQTSYSSIGKSFLHTNNSTTPVAVKQFITVYLKPFLLATVVTLFTAVALCFVFITLAGTLASDIKNTPAVAPDKVPEQTNPDAFLKKVTGTYPATVTEDFATVQLGAGVVYRIQHKSTYQEMATTDYTMLQSITRQLDANGIEYEVFKNNSHAVLLRKGEWVVSWGGTLYLPNATVCVR